jgi:hypothetical protein
MSFIVVVYVREGIVMAADSRLTLSMERKQDSKSLQHVAVSLSDSSRKLFLTTGGVGLAAFGQAEIGGMPLAGFIDSFIRGQDDEMLSSPHSLSNGLLKYMSSFNPVPLTQFYVAGYDNDSNEPKQTILQVNVQNESIELKNPDGTPGATWGGEGDILGRIVQPARIINQDGTNGSEFPRHQIPFQFFTLQDAIDFSLFAMQATSGAIRFQTRPKSVGGPIDILYIMPTESMWIQQKSLHA